MEKTLMLLLALGLVTLAECMNLNPKNIRRKRALPMEGVSTVGANTRAESGNFIVQLVETPPVQVEDILIVRYNLGASESTGKWTHLLPEKLVELIKDPATEKVSRPPMDCQEVQENGHNETGVYEVWPRNRLTDGRSVKVWCDMHTDGGGWTVIQRRGNFSEQENFDKDWQDYKNGFGDPSQSYWIGNDHIYALSNQGAYSARFDMKDRTGDTAYELYREFWIEDENSNYTLHISNSSGTAGDCMWNNNGRAFSTKDRDNDEFSGSCAINRKSGFWWKKCGYCNPNGVYHPGEARQQSSDMYYRLWKNRGMEGLYAMEIKLKRL